ncbi:MAG: hypothetical protein JWN32_718 [Solirubrobacterales bacterium]|jgi:uncharacterized protein (DUF1330 family)|nr:hypothetical protein [Solirubrobacterales bacterium]
MPAYLIADVEVHDPDAYARYRELSSESVARHGGRWIVRGGAHEVVEGDWEPGRLVVIEFDDMNAARAWWSSEDYRAAAEIRRGASVGRFVLVEGPTSAPRAS